MSTPIMPKATAVWLLENTTLTFEQIATFCGLHPLEIEAIENSEAGTGIVGIDPIATGQLTRDEITRCEKEPTQPLKLSKQEAEKKVTGTRYTPIARRQDRPNAIAWLVRHHPELTEAQIVRLIRTTKHTIDSIKTRKHWNMQNIKPENPVLLNLCTQKDLEKELKKAELKQKKA